MASEGDAAMMRHLRMLAAGRYVRPLSGRFRSVTSERHLRAMVERGWITIDGDPRDGAITVTDAGRVAAGKG